jgi:hypothetical protein
MPTFKLLLALMLFVSFTSSSCKKKNKEDEKGTCTDGYLNNGEELADCGGPCAPCKKPVVTSINFYLRTSGSLQDTLVFDDVSVNNDTNWIVSGLNDSIKFSFDFGGSATLGQHAILNSSNSYVKIKNVDYPNLVHPTASYVVVTEKDDYNNYISGNFQMYFCTNGGTDTVYVNNGAFSGLIFH